MNFLKKIFSSKNQEFQKAEVLLEVKSHSCPITAFVEQDNRVAYFYLYSENKQFGLKSCWVRNLIEAPEELEVKLMKKGIPPLLPKKNCKHPSGGKRLHKDNLEIVWLEEGDAAALLENGEVISIIPSWSGYKEFSGYSRDYKGAGDLAWELRDDNEMLSRIDKSSDFINSWDKDVNPFQDLQPRILKHYEELFGKSERYFAIDNKEWPPKGLFLLEGINKIIFATVAVSLRPQPSIEMYTENRNDINRIELGLMLNSGLAEEQIKKIASWISALASMPWDKITFLAEGQTVNFEIFNSSIMDSVVLIDKLDVYPKVDLPEFRDSKTNFLWMVPISTRESDKISEEGSEYMLSKLNSIGHDIFNLERAEVV